MKPDDPEESELDGEEEVELLIDEGFLYLESGEYELALELFLAATRARPESADAHYGVGLARAEQGEEGAMIAAFLRVVELDARHAAPVWALSEDEFAACAESAMAELPPRALELLENVPILIADAPDRALVEEGIDPRLLGLFSGVPLSMRSMLDPLFPSIDSIHIYKRNLERACVGREHLAEEIRITLLHETAHFFGMEEDELHEIGLG